MTTTHPPTTQPAPTITYVCPDWCRTPEDGHRWETECASGRAVQDHLGPEFGPVHIGSLEYANAPGQFVVSITISDDVESEYGAEEARQLGEQILAAAAWLEALGVQS